MCLLTIETLVWKWTLKKSAAIHTILYTNHFQRRIDPDNRRNDERNSEFGPIEQCEIVIRAVDFCNNGVIFDVNYQQTRRNGDTKLSNKERMTTENSDVNISQMSMERIKLLWAHKHWLYAQTKQVERKSKSQAIKTKTNKKNIEITKRDTISFFACILCVKRCFNWII